jgi:hypothetical protein
MRRRFPFLSLSNLLPGLLVLLTLACSDGRTPIAQGAAPAAAPQSLTYATNPASYTLGQAISANVPSNLGGTVTGYSVSPTLPTGLVLDATTGILSGTPTALAATAAYTVTATNGGGSTTVALSLAVNPSPTAPVFTLQPVNLTLTEGQNGQFVVAVSGTPTPTLEWQYSVSNGPWTGFGVTTPTYAVSGVTLGDNGRRYRVAAKNGAGTTYSDPATLTVNALLVAPTFTTQPGNATITEGQNAQFVVAATGAPAPTLQWQVSTNGGSSWADISGATNANFDVLGATLSQNAQQFRAMATNTSGSLPSQAAVLTVHAAQGAKAFGTAALLEAGPTAAGRPQIAFAPNGDAMAVWMQADSLYFHVWARHYTAASNSWGTEVLVGTGAGDGWDPKLAFDAQGNALVIWQQDSLAPGSVRYDIWSSYYTAGGGWGGPQLVESDDAGSAQSPEVVFDANGTGIAVWVQSDGIVSQARTNRYTAGTWGTVTILEASTPGASNTPQIAIDASGDAVVVWTRYDGVSDKIYSSRYALPGGWGAPVQIGSGLEPQVASDASGNALAVWTQSGGIWSNRYTTGVGWGTAALIEWSGGSASSAHVAFDPSGNAVAVWQQNGGFGTNSRIWSNRYTAGVGWGGFPSLIQTDSSGGATGTALTPQIAIDANGNALAVWVQPDGASDNTPDIWVNRYTAGSGWGTTANLGQIRINIPGAAGAPALQPQIAMDGNGNALVVWTQSDGVNDSIWFNRYQ